MTFLGVPTDEQLKTLFEYNRSKSLDVQTSSVSDRDGVKLHDLSYASPLGERITAYLVVPDGPGPFAGMIFMHGGNGNRASLLPGALVLARTGAVCLLIDSPLNGDRAKLGQPLADFAQPKRTREAMIQTVVDLDTPLPPLCSFKMGSATLSCQLNQSSATTLQEVSLKRSSGTRRGTR